MHVSLRRLSKTMFLLGESDVQKALSLGDILEINRQALVTITEKSCFVPSRLGIPYPNNPNRCDKKSSGEAQDWTLIKPAAYYNPKVEEDVAIGMKVVSVRANNPSNGLPLVPATILLLNAVSGMVEATIGGTSVTVARTSAGPALAVQAFQPNVQHLVIFGAGAQAECHVEIMEVALQRKIPRITIINRSRERAEALQAKFLADGRTGEVNVLLLSDVGAVNKALADADVVAATTNATDPLWEDGTILKKGCLITSIGSYTPDMKEIPESAVNRSHVIIDTPEAMEVGDLKHLKDASEHSHHPITLAGDALSNPGEIGASTDYIFFKAVGTAIQDVLAARSVVERAKAMGLGQEIDMS